MLAVYNQGGCDFTTRDDLNIARIKFPIMFSRCFNAEATIIGGYNDSMVLKNINNSYFEYFSHQNFNTDKHVVRPCSWSAYGIINV